ncbi:uncharacterized protein LOC129614222 [Condylostylus longicornis]|uniref:uncharacterized protein LOC129614222 n=1 Tax=Condylostylus longicornis TaxID=2530218 RepID=UPI00244E3C28|nr:uncharacterized protein LOC129614222 [Condylostylus longicornis]
MELNSTVNKTQFELEINMMNELDNRRRSRKASKADNIKLMRAMNYTKVLTPKNMKSEVWGYFGFPGNENNDIVTKNVLICTICYVMFRNNRNTTNLRMHLERVHKVDLGLSRNNPKSTDSFENNDSELYPASPSSLSPKSKQSKPKMKIYRANDLPDYKSEGTFDPLMENSMDVDNSPIFPDHDNTFPVIPKKEITEPIRHSLQPSDLIEESTCILELGRNIKEKPLGIITLLRNMIITDLMPPCSIENEGFRRLIQNLTKSSIPTRNDIENEIRSLYETKLKDLIFELKYITNKNPYSLSYEIWESVENTVFITFYVHYLTLNGTKETLKEVLFKTLKLTNYTNFDELFEHINLKNCAGIIAAYSTDSIEVFFSKKKIPILPCFECIVKNAINKVLSLPSVENVYAEIKETLQDFLTNHEIETPCENRNMTWAKYNIIKFFVENVVWPDDPNNELLPKAKNILDIISPLKITIDSLAEEPDALNSVSKPLAMQLVDNHFRANDDDTQIAAEIKEIVYVELANNILSNEMFTVTAFLDPRFRQYLGEDAYPTAKHYLLDKAKELNIVSCADKNNDTNTNESVNQDDLNSSQKKGLKQLFVKKDLLVKTNVVTNESFENDLKKYSLNASADLDESPLEWWNRYGYSYGNLKKVANIYNSMPCLCNKVSLKSIEKQIEFEDKKLNLRGNLINEILFLNYNYDAGNFS